MHRKTILAMAFMAAAPLFAQGTLVCQTSAQPPTVRAEGLAERVGDIVLNCSGGQPGATITTNLTAFLSVNVTNHLSANGAVDAVLTVENNTPTFTSTPVNVPAMLFSQSAVVWQGVSFTLSPTGTATLRIANLRGNATQAANSVILAFISLTGPMSIPVSSAQFTVAIPQTSAFASFGSSIVCDLAGSPSPANISVPDFLGAGTMRAGVRLSEGFASAFAPKNDWSNLNADTGVRFLVKYSGLPGVARLYVPVFVAGSTADIPTSAGDLGVPASGGRYTPGRGELLLALVNGADANGAGGTIAAPTPASQTDLTAVSQLALTGGAGYAVYEVVDANPSARETVQIPSFVTAPPISTGGLFAATETVTLAPVSQVGTATVGATIPRFNGAPPASDCSILADCTALYFPRLSVAVDPAVTTVNITTATQKLTRWFMVQNSGSGMLSWSTSVQYVNGSGWLNVAPASSTGNGALVFDVLTTNLAPGTYQANIVINAGDAGSLTVPITLNLAAAPPPVTPKINAVTSAADPYANAVPGSLGTLYGARFSGRAVTVTFDGRPADILFSNDTQINVRVPVGVGLSPKVVATVDGLASDAYAATLSTIAPSIFPGAVVNENGTVNSASNPAKSGSIVVLYGTGAATAASVSAKVQNVDILNPLYGGPAPTLPGVQQVNLRVPDGMSSMQTDIRMCGAADTSSARVCGSAQKIWIQQ